MLQLSQTQREQAHEVLGSTRMDGMVSDEQIVKCTILDLAPGASVAGKSPEYLLARFESAIKTHGEDRERKAKMDAASAARVQRIDHGAGQVHMDAADQPETPTQHQDDPNALKPGWRNDAWRAAPTLSDGSDFVCTDTGCARVTPKPPAKHKPGWRNGAWKN